MTDFDKLGPRLFEALRQRALDDAADPHAAVDAFMEAAQAGARVLYSEGDGEVALLVPLTDGYEGPREVTVAPDGHPTKVLAHLDESRVVKVEGVGKFRVFELNPLQLKKRLAEVEGRARIALRGEGGDGWSPLGFEGWFWEDFPLVLHLATQGGLEVRPDVEVDPRDPNWKALGPELRGFVEETLGRPVPEVVHTSTLRQALDAAAARDDGAVAGALRSLRLCLEAPVAAQAAPAAAEGPDVASVRAPITAALGQGALTPGEYPQGLLRLAKELATSQGREADVVRLTRALGGRAVPPAELDAALDAALGAHFAAGRAPTLTLVDAVIDGAGDAMSMADLGALRRFREALDLQAEAELFGADLAQRPLSTATADAKLAELAQRLGEGTGLDERAVFQVASALTAAMNQDARRPAVLVLAGAKGPAVDRLVTRALALTEAAPIKIQGAADLRLDDPVGYLVGSPANEPGSAKGALVRAAKADQRFVASFTGLDRLGAQLADPDARQAALQGFWSFVAHAGRDAGFRGYDPDDPAKAQGAWVDLAGGVLMLQTAQSVAELRDALPEAVWAQLAPSVVPVGASPRTDVVKGVETLLGEHAREAAGLPDVRVELGDTARGFVEELLHGGMAPETVQEVLLQQLAPRLAFAAVDAGLAPKVRVDLARGVTRGELAKLRTAWLEGRFVSLAGIGASPFALYDAGAELAAPPKALSAKLAKALAEGDEVSRLRKLVAEYQRTASKKDQDLTHLVAANDGLARRADAAEVRIDALSFLNAQAVAEIQDLRVLNDEAKATITTLKGDLAEANRRIDSLNADLKKAKGAGEELRQALDTAVGERDELVRTLRRTEGEIEQAVRSLAEQHGADPNATFELVAASARGQGNRFVQGLLTQMHMVATGRALQEAMQHARRFGKFQDIARLASGYVRSARALGQPVDRRVMAGFEEAARLSGNGWSANMARDWEDAVGAQSRHHGEAPDVLGALVRNLLRQLRIRV